MNLKCIIVDDEPLALDILAEYVRRTPTLELVARCSRCVEALETIEQSEVDLAFLDIQMPGMNGLELSKQLGEDTKIIFTTAFPQYALEGFRVDALDYLLKPISFEEFTRAVTRAEEWFSMKRAAQSGTENSTPQNLIVRSDYKQYIIPIDTIVYIEGIRDYIRIHTEEGGSIQTLMNLKTAEELLPSNCFARVHRSYIVNLEKVIKIERTNIVFGNVTIPISDTYKKQFLKLLNARVIKL
jgi:DNA-binding LytR/AlgR family response regulator